ncbi:alpha/beta hydrolase [Oleiharenicola lentus]|uniref:Alpha/beta hydrolase n=1 Tax=Oleiharenicola lentus TaxID=2508720 RepID=A0A4Q1C7R5_9BACT|nr:alpha/beta fold hydrolase [Oleiharenicola lentus]RXK54822.1 alpha/beta hydrolase [Oleiharenicola lentus]
MKHLLAFLAGLLCLTAMPAREKPAVPDCVVLLHGIGMRSYVMKRLESALRAEGYRTVSISYPSRRMPFEQLAGEYLPAHLKKHDVARAPRLHFVTHSLGSLIVRKLIKDARPANLGRVVMIGPPNHGSTAADVAKENALLKKFLGGNLVRLGTGEDAIVKTLGPADFDVGIIAGEVAVNPVFGQALGGKNDGAVTIESARLEGMKDFLVVPYSHTLMLWRKEVVDQVRSFLREGKFRRNEERAPTKPAAAPSSL